MSGTTIPFRAPDATYSARAMWLRMYAEGGRWCRAELVDIFGVDAMMDVDLWGMEQNRQLRRWGRRGAAAVYGVTRECLVPPWVTVGELQAPMQAAQQHRMHVACGLSMAELEIAATSAWGRAA